MKKLLIALITLLSLQTAYADDDATNIRIKISGATNDNSYFLCMPAIGCLSIKDGNEGKVYSIYHDVKVRAIAILDVDKNFKVSIQEVPASCATGASADQTITISGELQPTKDQNIVINHLHCSVH